jgi:L-lactate dehydrogenase complex protein LldG
VVIDRFITEAEKVSCTIAEVGSTADVPTAIADYLRQHNLPGNAVIAPDAWLQDIPWDKEAMLNLRSGASNKDDEVSITPAYGAVAETGTLMMASGPDHPTSLNFTPENHLVVLRKSQVVASYEEVWDSLRKAGKLPRSVNMITGPSRTGDISMQIYLGAHGPRRLHIVMVDD